MEHVAAEHKVWGLYAVVDERAVFERQTAADLECNAPVYVVNQVASADEFDRGDRGGSNPAGNAGAKSFAVRVPCIKLIV